ncbi:MAG: SPOR domain-containing protein [Candidatus Omnitrophica bacterium]|nr:SPOR domain-containing protein [Candidatus Omnitrophota bacterium]
MRGEQLKLFSEGNDSNSRLKRRLIVIPLDTFILSSVVILLLFVLAFSLGIEKGRKIAILSEDAVALPEKELKTENVSVPAQAKALPVKEQKVIAGQITKQLPIAPIAEKKIEIAQPVAVKEGYCIQVASYNKESFALDEAKRLKDKGFAAYTAKKGSFVVLYVGNFKTSAEAQKTMRLLKKNYKDCVLRRF